jgi:uncharacterized protein YkwD
MNRRAVMIAVSLFVAMLIPGSQAQASGFSYALVTPPTVSAPGQYASAVLAVASVDGVMTIDVTALDGTAITGVDDPGVCTVTPVGAHCAYKVPMAVQESLGVSGTYSGSVVHLRVAASDGNGPVTLDPDMSFPVLPVTLPVMPTPPPMSDAAPRAVPLTVAPIVAASNRPAFTSRRERVVVLTNAQRAAHGLGGLTVSPQLTASAGRYAQHLAADGAFSHTDGSDLAQRVTAVGYQYQWIGENLGMGQSSPKTIVQAWMNSPEHRANMLDPRFTQIGVGVATRSDGRIIWCIDLGWPKSAPTKPVPTR